MTTFERVTAAAAWAEFERVMAAAWARAYIGDSTEERET